MVAVAVLSGLSLTNSYSEAGSESEYVPFGHVSIGNGDIIIGPADKNWRGFGDNAYAARLQGAITIEPSGTEGTYDVFGLLVYYGGNDGEIWNSGTWGTGESMGYYLALDMSGSTASFTRIADKDYNDGWNVSKNGSVLVLFLGNEKSGISVTLVQFFTDGYDPVFTLDLAGIDAVPEVMKVKDTKVTKDESTGENVLFVDFNFQDAIPAEQYCLIVPEKLTNDKGKYVHVDSIASKNKTTDHFRRDLYLRYTIFEGDIGIGVYTVSAPVFSGCKNLVAMSTLGKVTHVAASSFSTLSGLKEVDIGGPLRGTTVFSGCSSLETLRITNDFSLYLSPTPSGTDWNSQLDVSVRKHFSDCPNLSNIVIVNDNVKIADDIFSHYNQGKGAMMGPISEFKLYLEGSDITIGARAFQLSNLTEIIGSEKIASVGANAFESSKLTGDVFISNKITSDVHSAFGGCDISSFTVDPNNSAYSSQDGIVFNKSKTEVLFCPVLKVGSVVLPDSVTAIGAGAFSGCSGLTEIILPSKLETVGPRAFENCVLISEVTVPESVTVIGENAFAGCAEEGTIKFMGDEDAITLGSGYIPGGWTVEVLAFNGSRITFNENRGTITAVHSSEGPLRSGSIAPEGTVTFTFAPADGYEFINWTVTPKGSNPYTSDDAVLTLTVTEESQNTAISVNLGFYSTSNILIPLVYTGMPIEDLQRLWSFRSPLTTSGGMTAWTLTSTPLIVGNYLYAYTGTELYKINTSNGDVMKTVNVEPVSAFYRYLGYGDGFIIDFNGGYIFDTDLNVAAKTDPMEAAFYHDGAFYGLFKSDVTGSSVIKKFTIEKADDSQYGYEAVYADNDNWSAGVTAEWFRLYGTTSAPVFAGDRMYFIGANATANGMGSTNIYLNSIDINTGNYVQTELPELYGHLMDDGWITYDNGKVYISSYGEKTGAYIARVTLGQNGGIGEFINVTIPGGSGATSAFVIYGDRGYVNTRNGYLSVYDMKTFGPDATPVYQEKSTDAHGSIVLDVSRATAGNGNLVYIYIVPYNGTGDLLIIEDHAGKTSAGTQYTLKVRTTYSSQAVRSTADGKLIWYSDDGNIWCYGIPSAEVPSQYWFAVHSVDSEYNGSLDVISGMGFTPEEALKQAVGSGYDSISESYLFRYDGPDDGLTRCLITEPSLPYVFFLSDLVDDAAFIDGSAVWYKVLFDSVEPITLGEIIDAISENTGVSFYTYSQHLVSFDVNYGNELMSDFLWRDSTALTVPAYTGTRTGYTFMGWDDGNTVYPEGNTYPFGRADVHFTASWASVSDPVASVFLSRNSGTLNVGGSTVLTASASPAAALQSVWWSSSNTSVAAVDSKGTVTAVSEGTATITATSVDGGKTAVCTITVEKDRGTGTDITIVLSEKLADLKTGENITLRATVTGTTAKVVWTSSNTSVAAVSSSGLVTAVSEGTATITAAVGGKTAVCVVNVGDASAAFEIDAAVTVSSGSAAVGRTQIESIAGKVREAQKAGDTEIVVNFDAGSAPLTISSFSILADTGAIINIVTDDGHIEIPSDVAKKIAPSSDSGEFRAELVSVSYSDLNNAQKSNTKENAKVFQINIRSGNSDIHVLGGTVRIYLQYTPPEGVSTDDVLLTYLGEDGSTEDIPFTYRGGYIEAAVPHLSYYSVDYVPTDSEAQPSPISLEIAALAVAVIAIVSLAAVFVLRRA
jgi:hypothetical protein